MSGPPRLGIGFATGRRSFKKVLFSHLSVWKESRETLPPEQTPRLSLFVSYDLDYQNTRPADFTNLGPEITEHFDEIVFMGAKNAARSLGRSALSAEGRKAVFGPGYAGKRNAVLLSAIEHQMDYLLFLDDDEYPMAVTNAGGFCLCSGQQVFLAHLKEIAAADYTNGRHCGYISPIPQIDFDAVFGEDDLRRFIEAISNDILSWESVRDLARSGGVTYASAAVLADGDTDEVPWEKGCRFISGANLCVNLKDPARTFPFYNPPGARGEDTFLSTLLHERRVVKIPCYTFHDGFSYYPRVLDGALPIRLRPIRATSPRIVSRFFSACVGWTRYKPLLLYITERETFAERTEAIRAALEETAPKLAARFGDGRFLTIPGEFEKYHRNAAKHCGQFALARNAWREIVSTAGKTEKG